MCFSIFKTCICKIYLICILCNYFSKRCEVFNRLLILFWSVWSFLCRYWITLDDSSGLLILCSIFIICICYLYCISSFLSHWFLKRILYYLFFINNLDFSHLSCKREKFSFGPKQFWCNNALIMVRDFLFMFRLLLIS